MGEEHQNDQKNCGYISPEELRRSGMCNPIRMDISSTCRLGNRRLVCRSAEDDLRKLFASSFLQKDKNPLTHSRSYKYDACQEIRTATHESSDVSTGEIPKLPVGSAEMVQAVKGVEVF